MVVSTKNPFNQEYHSTSFGVEDESHYKVQNIKRKKDSHTKKTSEVGSRLLVLPPRPNNSLVSTSIELKPELQAYGLTKNKFILLQDFYNKNFRSLSYLKFPKLLHHAQIRSHFPYSIVLIPARLRKRGMYALLKDQEINKGAFNRIVYALRLGKNPLIKVFRSALRDNVPLEELQANLKTARYPQAFVGGNYVHYKGNYRDRNPDVSEGVSREEFKKIVKKKIGVKKTGIILDYAEGETLFHLLEKSKCPEQKIVYHISKGCAEALNILHERLKIVHFDLKPENIFLDNNRIKIGDFGFTIPIGEKRSAGGTPGYIAPELIRSKFENTDYLANPKADIWAIGCVFANLSGNTSWYNWSINIGFKAWMQITPEKFEMIKDNYFTNRKNINHYDYVIDKCLQLSPESRFSAAQILQWLNVSYLSI
jgi:hypothetical protein